MDGKLMLIRGDELVVRIDDQEQTVVEVVHGDGRRADTVMIGVQTERLAKLIVGQYEFDIVWKW